MSTSITQRAFDGFDQSFSKEPICLALKSGLNSIVRKKIRSQDMSQQLVTATEKAGTKISKEKLIEAIKRSPQREYSFSGSHNSKTVVVVISL